jgi:hypothetical protein
MPQPTDFAELDRAIERIRENFRSRLSQKFSRGQKENGNISSRDQITLERAEHGRPPQPLPSPPSKKVYLPPESGASPDPVPAEPLLSWLRGRLARIFG